MKGWTRRAVLRSGAVAALALTVAGCASTATTATDELWIRGARIADPRSGGSARIADVVVRNGRIDAVEEPGRQPPAGATVFEATGLWLAPGPFDAHVHVSGVPGMTAVDSDQKRRLRDLYRDQVGRSFLLHGFTQVVDLNHANVEAIAWFGRGDGPAPDLLHAGTGLTMAGGYPLVFVPKADLWGYSNFLLEPDADLSSLPPGVDPAEHTPEAAVARVAAAGGIAVKVFWESGFGGFRDLPTPSREILERIAAAAHERGLPVVVHANALPAWDFVTRAPIEAVVHGMWNWKQHEGEESLPEEISEVVDRAVSAGIAVMPTTRVIGGLRDLFDPAFLDDPRLAAVYPPEYLAWLRAGNGWELRDEIRGGDFDGLADDSRIRGIMERVRDQGDRVLLAFVQRGGELVFGSDTPSAPIPSNPPGLNGRLELEHFEAIGLDPVAAARALTVAPAELFGLEGDYGEVAVGRKANLLLLRADPLASIAAWGEIERVVLGGRMLDPDGLRADR